MAHHPDNMDKVSVYTVFVIIISLWMGCKVNQPVPIPADAIKIIHLEAKDISENLTSISTQDDEIFFSYYFLEEKDGQSVITDEKVWDEFLFDSLQTLQTLDAIHDIKENDFLVFCLVELDDLDSHDKVKHVLRATLSESNTKMNLKKSYMDSLLSDDDFLGYKKLDLRRIQKGEEKELSIKGIQLFDKYDYRIRIQGF